MSAVQAKVEEVEHALYGAQRAKEEAAKRAALEERLAKRVAEREKIEKAKDWSEEEVRMLEKALDKFPPVRNLIPGCRTRCAGLFAALGPVPYLLLSATQRHWRSDNCKAYLLCLLYICLSLCSEAEAQAVVSTGHREAVGDRGSVRAHAHCQRGAGHGQAWPQGWEVCAQAGHLQCGQEAPGQRWMHPKKLNICPF